jgi:hypothetical protein
MQQRKHVKILISGFKRAFGFAPAKYTGNDFVFPQVKSRSFLVNFTLGASTSQREEESKSILTANSSSSHAHPLSIYICAAFWVRLRAKTHQKRACFQYASCKEKGKYIAAFWLFLICLLPTARLDAGAEAFLVRTKKSPHASLFLEEIFYIWMIARLGQLRRLTIFWE